MLFVEQLAAADCVDDARPTGGLRRQRERRDVRAATDGVRLRRRRRARLPRRRARARHVAGASCSSALGEAALLVNLSGHLRWRPALARLPRRVFVDLDPGYTQIWHASGGDAAGLEGHDAALHRRRERRHAPDATCRPAGIRWRPIRQPVVLDRWPVPRGRCRDFSRFTTVASWRGAYGRPVWEGRSYGAEGARVPPLRVAAGAHRPAVRGRARHPPGRRARRRAACARAAGGCSTPRSSATSRASAASCAARARSSRRPRACYVETRSGWFSDRTVRYLACGRPALVQDTGFSEQLPVGEGLLAFRTPAEARAGAHAIVADYARHSAAARALAERCFAPAPALAPLLEAAGVAPRVPGCGCGEVREGSLTSCSCATPATPGRSSCRPITPTCRASCAAAWGGPGFARPEPLESFVRAARSATTTAGPTWELQPRLDADGAPQPSRCAGVPVHLAFYRGGVEVVRRGPARGPARLDAHERALPRALRRDARRRASSRRGRARPVDTFVEQEEDARSRCAACSTPTRRGAGRATRCCRRSTSLAHFGLAHVEAACRARARARRLRTGRSVRLAIEPSGRGAAPRPGSVRRGHLLADHAPPSRAKPKRGGR